MGPTNEAPRGDWQVTATRMDRRIQILRAYDLASRLKGKSPAERDEIIAQTAMDTGRDPKTLTKEAEMAEGIAWADLQDAFKAETITEEEWLERLTIDHLMAINQARDGFRVLTSKEKAAITVEAFHAALSVDELRQTLARRRLIAERAGVQSRPTKGATATAALRELADYLERTGQDFPMSSLYLDPMGKGRPISLFEALGAIRDRYFKLYPKLLIPREMAQRWTTKAPRT